MAWSLSAPFGSRARRVVALLVPVVLLAAAGGCGKHRTRTSLRPIFTRSRPVVGCPTGNCGGSSIVVPSSPGATVTPLSPPVTTSEPALIESGVAPGSSLEGPSPYMSTPSTSGLPDSPPPVSGPSLPDEPGLEPVGGEEESRPSAVPAPRDAAPGSLSPGASLHNSSGTSNGRRSASRRPRQAALGERVRPFVNDPEDLFAPPRADRPWKYIVLHHSASATGGYDSIDRQHRDRLGWQGCGYHFIIGNGSETPDGTIEVARRWSQQKHGVHCRDGKNPDVNEYGIGICLVGDLEKSPPTPRQIAAARALVAYLSDRYQIDPRHTETHAHLAASPTACPGRMFPAQAILGTTGMASR